MQEYLGDKRHNRRWLF